MLERAARATIAAFATLWREYHPPLLRYLPRHHGRGRRRRRVGDLGGGHRPRSRQFDGDEAAFRAWLFTVARRRAIDHFRAKSRRPAVPVDPVCSAPAPVLAERSDPGDAALARSRLESAARRSSPTLPDAQAEAVMLRAIGGLDVAHVAAIMGKRPGTVRVLAHRGLRTLARRLSEEEHRAVTP